MNNRYDDNKKAQDLKKALVRLHEAIFLPIGKNQIEIDASIQRFEFCIELFWKALQHTLLVEFGTVANASKKVLQQAYINGLITNENIWIQMIDDRNLTSHTYNKELAYEMYQRIKIYAPFLQSQYESCFKK